MNKHIIVVVMALMLASCSLVSNPNWFASKTGLSLTDKGLININASTPLTKEALNTVLKDRYTLRYGMKMVDNQMVAFYQAIDLKNKEAEKIALIFYAEPQKNVQSIEVLDPIVNSWGVEIGTYFNDIYAQAFALCTRGKGSDGKYVICQAPQSDKVSYVFEGQWNGPNSLIPSDDVLKNWRIARIEWHAKPSAQPVSLTNLSTFDDILLPPAQLTTTEETVIINEDN